MNSDGKIDFVFTGTSPQNGITALYYVPNKSDNGHDFSGQTLQSTNFTLGQNETVLIEDVNLDGRTDLLVGKSTGAIEYWRNQGPAGETNYVLENTSFLGLGTSIERQNPALASGDLNADGKADLILADQKGFLSVYPDYRTQSTSIEPIKNLVYSPLKAEYTSKNLGGRGWPVIVNIFNTDKPSIIVGNALGGIHILKNDGGRELPEEPVIDLFPNPVAENGDFKIKADRTVSVQFLTLLGQKISEPISIPANQEYPITISGMPPGIYIARFSSNGKIVGKKFIVQ